MFFHSGLLPSLNYGVPKVMKCQHFKSPKNGAIECGGSLCFVKCNEGFTEIFGLHAFVYNCDKKNGQWSTIPKGLPIPWPNCIKVCNFHYTFDDNLPIIQFYVLKTQ